MLSPEIIEARRGNVTASQAARIMAGWEATPPAGNYPPELYDWIVLHGKPKVGDVKGVLDCEVSGALINAAWAAHQFAKPPAGLVTYAEELAADSLAEHDPMTDVNTRAMEFGVEREIEAVERFIEKTGVTLTKTGDDQIHISSNGVGCTPDGIVYDDLDLVVTGAEIKSRIPLHHSRQLLIVDNATLLACDPDRYCQMQVSMLVCGCETWHCVSYNPHMRRVEHQLHCSVIRRDEQFLSAFRRRAAMVFEHKAAFLARIEASDAKRAEALAAIRETNQQERTA